MQKKILIIFSLLLIILALIGILKFKSKPADEIQSEKNIIMLSSDSNCGDDICDADENCNNCPEDCICAPDEYCSKYNSCLKKEVCGDYICTDKEKAERNCCIDCENICSNNELCSTATKKCVEKAQVRQEFIDRIIKENTGRNYTFIHTENIIYENNVAVEILFDCTSKDDLVKCRHSVIVSDDNTILDEESIFY